MQHRERVTLRESPRMVFNADAVTKPAPSKAGISNGRYAIALASIAYQFFLAAGNSSMARS
jgi:hypothetical protein